MEGKITLIEGDDLNHLCAVLGMPEEGRPYAVRIYQTIGHDAVKVKVNGGMWTPLLGRKDESA